MKKRTKAETLEEIERIEIALSKTKSVHLKQQYGKHLNRLKKSLYMFTE